MPILLNCPCGRSMRIKDEFAEKKIKCPACLEIMKVPPRDVDMEDAAARALLEDDPKPADLDSAGVPGARTSLPEQNADPGYQFEPQQPPPPASPEYSKKKRKPAAIKRKKSSIRSGLPQIAISPQILASAGTFLFGLVWLLIALQFNRIYFYAIFLIFAGLYGIIAGLSGKAE